MKNKLQLFIAVPAIIRTRLSRFFFSQGNLKVRKEFFITAFLTLLVACAFAQPQQREWALPGNEVKFNPVPSVSALIINDYDGETAFSGANGMTDANGNLLFYVMNMAGSTSLDMISIYDGNGFKIDDLKFAPSVSITDGMAPEIGIVPVPNSCSKYYIIVGVGATTTTAFYHPEYAVLDMSKPNINDPSKFGALEYSSATVNTTNLQNLYSVLEFVWDPADHGASAGSEKNRYGIAITPYRSDSNDYFLYINGVSNMCRFVIKSNGIFLDNTASDGGVIDYSTISGLTFRDNQQYAEMEIIRLPGTGNYRAAKVNEGRQIWIFEFSYATGMYIPYSYRQLDVIPAGGSPASVYSTVGLEFSPSGNELYFTDITHAGLQAMGYFDLTSISTSTTPPPPHMLPFPGTGSLGKSFIEMGFDGNMYFNTGSQLMQLKPPFNLPVPARWNPSVGLPSGIGPLVQTLPDQMDGQDYKNNPVFISYTAGTPGASTYGAYVNPSQVWTPTSNPFGGTASSPVGTASNPVIILGKLVIPAGYNITIKGMTFKFRPREVIYSSSGAVSYNYGARVIVQNYTGPGTGVGGRLTLQNLATTPTVFTSNNCGKDGMWEGIEVWGSSTQLQGSFAGPVAGKQGWLRLYSSASPAASTTISNAYIGALAGAKSTYPFLEILSGSGGGIIQAFANTEFLNNQYGVYFMPYNAANNASYFLSNKFTTNAAFISDDMATPFFMAYLNDVKGIYFKSSVFTNTPAFYPPTTSPGSATNSAIYSYHSQFYCVPAIYGSALGCSFNNFKYGIYATFVAASKTMTTDFSVFTNNYRSVYISNATLAPTVTRNIFNILPYNSPVTANKAYGLYLNACDQYKVEGNDFTTMGAISTVNDIGCIVNNSGPNPNAIYRNNFHEISIGIQAQNTNCHQQTTSPDPINDKGLQNLCNSFSTMPVMDIGITSGCIDNHQGLALAPAGNSFSHTGLAALDYFTYSEIDPLAFITYIHNSDLSQTPLNYTPPPAIILGDNGLLYDASTQCLSTMAGLHLTKPLGHLKAQIQNYQTKIATLQADLDAGKSSSLITAINSSMLPADLKKLLLTYSPYLSDEVLIDAITQAKTLSPAQLKDIIVANSPVTQPVLDALSSIKLPNNILSQIQAAQTGISRRAEAIDKINYYTFQVNMDKNDIVREYMNDPSNDIQADTIIQKIIDSEGIDPIGADKKEVLADLYTEKLDFNTAEAMLTEVETIPGKQNLVKIKRVSKSLKQQGQTTDGLLTDVNDAQIVNQVAADNTKQGYETATNMLQQVFAQSYAEPIDEQAPGAGSNRSFAPAKQKTALQRSAEIYPNPNNGLMQLNYSLNADETGELRIMDVTGRMVAQYNLDVNEKSLQINLTGLNSGVYAYHVLTNGNIVSTDKLIIVK